MTTAISDSWLDEAIAELEADGYVPHQPSRPPTRARKAKAHTALTRRIHDFITREFKEGAAGNRSSLPSTYDVAKACVWHGGDADSCRRVMKHLRRLMKSGDIVQVKDEDVSVWSWHRSFWALSNSGLELGGVEQPVAPPLNRHGFSDEAWAAMKPWQRNAIRSIDMAETASSSW